MFIVSMPFKAQTIAGFAMRTDIAKINDCHGNKQSAKARPKAPGISFRGFGNKCHDNSGDNTFQNKITIHISPRIAVISKSSA